MSTVIARAGDLHQWMGVGSTREEAVADLLRPRQEVPGLAGKVASTLELEGAEVVISLYTWGDVSRTLREPLVVREYA